MFDPLLKSAFVYLIYTVLKVLVMRYAPSFPINEEQINSIAFWVVTWLLALAGYQGFMTKLIPRLTKKWQANGFLPDKLN